MSSEDSKYCRNDITGNKYNMLTALYRVDNRGKQTYWRFRCDCGNEKEINKYSVLRGVSKSCGCLRVKSSKERGKLQAGKPRGRYKYENVDMTLYNVWVGIRSKACERWNDYENFVEDMLPGYKKGLQIDRIDKNGDYEYSNCRWITNNRVNRMITTPDGRELTMKQAAEEYNIPYHTLRHRIVYGGWDPIEALETERKK